ncbi:MAG: TPR repeat protein [Motiliproteus sp.]|jgi:TPR repeat protein
MRGLLRLLAPLIFWITYRAFRSKRFKRSARKHRWMMSSFRLAADIGHTEALSVYGHLLFLRGDSPKSTIQGAVYLERAATQGDMKAQYQMGRISENGGGKDDRINLDKALDYYLQAAEQGHVLAVTRLADGYANAELGLLQDTAKAESWRQKMPS